MNDVELAPPEWWYRSRLAIAVGVAAMALSPFVLVFSVTYVRTHGGEPVGVFIFGLLMLVGGVGLLREHRRVGPKGIELSMPIRRRQIDWTQVERFRWADGTVYVALLDGELVALRTMDEVVPSRRREAARTLVAELEGLRMLYDAECQE